MIIYDKKRNQIVIPNGIGNLNLFNNGVEVGYEQGKIDGINIQKAKLESINITENGTYSIDDQETVRSIAFDGNSYFDTGIFPTENIKIEACIKITNGNDSSLGGIIIGGGIGKLGISTENRGIAIGMNGGGIYGIWGAIKSRNKPYKLEGEGTTTVVLQKTDDSWVWDGEKGSFGASTLYIGGYNSNDIAVEKRFLQSIVYIKIWTDRNDDSTMTLFRPKNMSQGAFGVVNSEGIETGYIENLGEGTVTFVKENVKKYPYGFKKVEVNVPDLNGSYDEGYAQGKTDGINEQKSKLESISITENGTYNKEDGYNHIEVNVPDLNGSYDEGYNQGQADVAANARVLNVTENGNYLSKFSDPIVPTVTGVYADGTKFYSYAELGNKVFNTNITVTQDSVIELWYKGDNAKTDDGWNTIFGCAKSDDDDFYLGYMYSDNTNLRGWIGQKQVQFSWDDNVWHHIIMKNDGLRIDDVLIGSFNTTKTFAYNLGLNGTWDSLTRNANGTFGMIKIDNTIIIPTADGFLNTNTGELIEVVKNGVYTFTENKIRYGEGELYKTINVDVKPKINVKKAGLKLGYSKFTEVPEWVDFDGITDMSYMFYNCLYLQKIPMLDTSNVFNMSYMFYFCSDLQTIPPINTSNVANMERMFYYCTKLKTLPELDASKLTNINGYFRNAGSNVTDVGGWKNLKINWNDNYGLKLCPNLTYQSCINVLNGLYDFTGNGETPNSNQGRLKVAQSFIDKVGDKISIGINKGWSITA